MTSDAGQTYVAQVLGGPNNTAKKAMALDSMKATAEMWAMKHQWHFLLNKQTISVTTPTDRYTLTGSGTGKPFSKPFSARFTGVLKRPIPYVPQQYIDAVTTDQTVLGDPECYTIIDDDADFDPSSEVQKVQLYPPPRANDTLVLRYYRAFNGAADPIDVPLRYLYTFLDCARIHLMMAHDSTNPRLPALILDMFGSRYQAGRFQLAISDDIHEGGDDMNIGFVTPTDLSRGNIPQGPADFWPKGDR